MFVNLDLFSTESTEDDLFPIEALTRSECHTLLECLTDTFEENKIAALKILTSPQVRKAAELLQVTHLIFAGL